MTTLNAKVRITGGPIPELLNKEGNIIMADSGHGLLNPRVTIRVLFPEYYGFIDGDHRNTAYFHEGEYEIL